LIVQFYRYLGAVSTAIGSPYTLVAGAANQSQGFNLETIDSNPTPGAYTYALNLIQSNGTTTWGAYSGAVLNAVELRGVQGPTGTNLLTTANTFSNTNTFTNTVTISTLAVSTMGNVTHSVTNVSTQNTQIIQTATSNPTTSYTTVQAFQSNTAGAGITYNTLALNPSGGNVGIGLTGPAYLLQLSSDSAAKPTTSTWTISSDQRLKTDITLADTQRCYDIIKAVPLKRYTWRPEVYTEDQVRDRSKLGWIAQDVEPVFPKAVGQQRFVYDQQWSTTETGERTLVSEQVLEDCRDLNVDQMYAVMYGAISRLIEEKEAQQEELTTVRAQVSTLQSQQAPLLAWAASQGFTGYP